MKMMVQELFNRQIKSMNLLSYQICQIPNKKSKNKNQLCKKNQIASIPLIILIWQTILRPVIHSCKQKTRKLRITQINKNHRLHRRYNFLTKKRK